MVTALRLHYLDAGTPNLWPMDLVTSRFSLLNRSNFSSLETLNLLCRNAAYCYCLLMSPLTLRIREAITSLFLSILSYRLWHSYR